MMSPLRRRPRRLFFYYITHSAKIKLKKSRPEKRFDSVKNSQTKAAAAEEKGAGTQTKDGAKKKKKIYKTVPKTIDKQDKL